MDEDFYLIASAPQKSGDFPGVDILQRGASPDRAETGFFPVDRQAVTTVRRNSQKNGFREPVAIELPVEFTEEVFLAGLFFLPPFRDFRVGDPGCGKWKKE